MFLGRKLVKVRLSGLNIRPSKGKWYVSIRGGRSLIKGFEGSKADLERYMQSPEFLLKLALAQKVGSNFDESSLGGLIDWFKMETIRWEALSTTTQREYENLFAWIGADLHYPASEIGTQGIVTLRNKAAKEKWPRFADKLVSALSSVFSEATLVGKVQVNPCRGVPRLHRNDPNANREWPETELQKALQSAPRHIQLPLLIARYAGFRGGDIQPLKWSAYTGTSLQITAAKNEVLYQVPVLNSQPLKAALDEAKQQANSIFICVSSSGRPWANEKVMQGAVSKHLRQHVEAGLTLHGLRVTYASQFRRLGLDDRTIADLIGDKSPSMGSHYTRHVERQIAIDKGFQILHERRK